jgi:hypothetical protein
MSNFLLQINFGASAASIIGLLYVALGLVYFFSSLPGCYPAFGV